jgi:hypothetical protein
VRGVARPGQRCTTAVLLYLYGTIAGVYPISPHPALRTPAGDLAFIALGARSPGVGVALLQLDSPEAASADPGRTGGFEIGVPILPVAACGQRYYLGGFAYPLAGRLDLSVAGSSAKPVHYLVPARLTRPKEPGCGTAPDKPATRSEFCLPHKCERHCAGKATTSITARTAQSSAAAHSAGSAGVEYPEPERRLHRARGHFGSASWGASAASSYVCPVDDAAEPFVVGVVVAPDDVPADHACLFLVAGVAGSVECEVPQRRELGFYAV